MAKTYMKADEMQILKAITVKIDDDHVLMATLQYHTEKNPTTGKNDRSKSIYRWLARVENVNTLKETIKEMLSDAHRLEDWKWPDDPNWNGKMYASDNTKYAGAKWLNLKLNKAMSWEDGQKKLNGWDKKKEAYNPNGKYEIKDYVTEDGTKVDLDDKDALLKQVGKNLLKVVLLKSQLAD